MTPVAGVAGGVAIGIFEWSIGAGVEGFVPAAGLAVGAVPIGIFE